jgi:hypothetical protein
MFLGFERNGSDVLPGAAMWLSALWVLGSGYFSFG